MTSDLLGNWQDIVYLLTGDENGEITVGKGGRVDAAESFRQFESDLAGARSPGYDGVTT